MPAQEIKAVLTERIKRTSFVESFRFKPENKVGFLPGQYLKVIFDEKNRNNSSLNKFLSFSSAPDKDYFEVTKKISDSSFSGCLKSLKQGDKVLFQGPLGNCVLREDYTKIGFLIGGIGITPVISMLEAIADKGLGIDTCLLYSNQTQEDIAFKKELDAWAQNNKKNKTVYTVTSGPARDKNIHLGLIDEDFLRAQMGDYSQRMIFIFGPPKMVAAMKDICIKAGCPKEKIKIENFLGY